MTKTSTLAQRILDNRKPKGVYRGHHFDHEQYFHWDSPKPVLDKVHNPKIEHMRWYEGQEPPKCNGCGRSLVGLIESEYHPDCENPGDQYNLVLVNVVRETVDLDSVDPLYLADPEEWQSQANKRAEASLEAFRKHKKATTTKRSPKVSLNQSPLKRSKPFWYRNHYDPDRIEELFRWRESEKKIYEEYCQNSSILDRYFEADLAPPPIGVQYRNWPPLSLKEMVSIRLQFDDWLEEKDLPKYEDDKKDSGKPVIINGEPVEKNIIIGGNTLKCCTDYDEWIIDQWWHD